MTVGPALRAACAVGAAVGATLLLITAFTSNVEGIFPALTRLGHPGYELRRWLSTAETGGIQAPESTEGGMMLFPSVAVLQEVSLENASNATSDLTPTSLDGGMLLFPPTPLKVMEKDTDTSQSTTPLYESDGGGMSIFPPAAIDDTMASGVDSGGMALFPPVSLVAHQEDTESETSNTTTTTTTRMGHQEDTDSENSTTTTSTTMLSSSTTSSTLITSTTTVTSSLSLQTTTVAMNITGLWARMDANDDGSVDAGEWSLAANIRPQDVQFSDIDTNSDGVISKSEYMSQSDYMTWEQNYIASQAATVRTTTTTAANATAVVTEEEKDDGPWWFWLVMVVVILIVAWTCFVCITKNVLWYIEKRKRENEEEAMPFKDDDGQGKDEEIIDIGPPLHQSREVVPDSWGSKQDDAEGSEQAQSEIFVSPKGEEEVPARPEPEAEVIAVKPAADSDPMPDTAEPAADEVAGVAAAAGAAAAGAAAIAEASTSKETSGTREMEEVVDFKKPPSPPPAGPFMQGFDKDYYSRHMLRSIPGPAAESLNRTPYQEYHRGVAEKRLQAAVEADSLSELTAAIAHAKSQAVPTDLVWYAEVCRRRRTVVAELQDIVETLTGKRASAKLWRALWSKKMSVLQDLREKARKDPDCVLRELQVQE